MSVVDISAGGSVVPEVTSEILHFPMALHISILTAVSSAADVQDRLEMETMG